jgi:hypothetical protein
VAVKIAVSCAVPHVILFQLIRGCRTAALGSSKRMSLKPNTLMRRHRRAPARHAWVGSAARGAVYWPGRPRCRPALYQSRFSLGRALCSRSGLSLRKAALARWPPGSPRRCVSPASRDAAGAQIRAPACPRERDGLMTLMGHRRAVGRCAIRPVFRSVKGRCGLRIGDVFVAYTRAVVRRGRAHPLTASKLAR